MNKNFLLNMKPYNEYDFIDGRIAILETFLFKIEELKRFLTLPYEEIVKEIENSTYGKYVKSKEIDDVSKGFNAKHNDELEELAKYVSVGFINVFAKSKELFLKIKMWATNGAVNIEEDDMPLNLFVTQGKGDFPLILRDYFKALKKESTSPFVSSVLTDIYHIKFLNDFAKKTKSEFIIDYFKQYAEIYSWVLIVRASELLKTRSITENEFNFINLKLVEEFKGFDFARQYENLKSYDDFIVLSREKEELYDTKVNENFDNAISERLFGLIEEGKFFFEGIEPVFVYLERLNFELDFLMHSVYSAYNRVSEDRKVVQGNG
jgi:hypothetical protein